MKFQVREGFVCRLVNKIDTGDGKIEMQEHVLYGGQTADLTAEQADQHAHKLEPKDKAAEAYLAGKVLPSAPGATLGITPESLALVQALATAMAEQMLATLKKSAPAAT